MHSLFHTHPEKNVTTEGNEIYNENLCLLTVTKAHSPLPFVKDWDVHS